MKLPIYYMKSGMVTFGGKPLLDGIDFQVMRGDRICLIGRNGCGKSTLLKTIMGIHELDAGEIYKMPGIRVGFLPQIVEFEERETVREHVLGGIEAEDEAELEEKKFLADIVIERLGLEADKPMELASGGKKRRASLARALVEEPEFLLLDEPTNHLDIGAIEWLEEYLLSYRGAIICISHDRRFLERISNRTFWIDRSKLFENDKGFGDFERWSEYLYEQEEKSLSKMKRQLDEETIWLHQGVTARRKRNQQRLGNLLALREKLRRAEEQSGKGRSSIALPPLSNDQLSRLIFEMDEVSFAFTDVQPPKQMIKNFSIRVLRGEKIGIMGKNGAGKTTFLRLVTGDLEPTSGKIRHGANLAISYFDQKREQLDPNKTLWQTLCPNGGDRVALTNGRFMHVVAYLKQFLFEPKEAEYKVSTLSGGQANRLLLAKILANPGNLLILDEPTNDLDMDTLDVLQETLQDYEGTLILVSHDRDFVDRLATRTLIFQDHLKITDYIGGFSDQPDNSKERIKEKPQAKDDKKTILKESVKPTIDSKKLSYNEQRDLNILPEEIDTLIQEIKTIEEELHDQDLYLQNPEKFNLLSSSLAQKKELLDQKELRLLFILDKIG